MSSFVLGSRVSVRTGHRRAAGLRKSRRFRIRDRTAGRSNHADVGPDGDGAESDVSGQRLAARR